MATIELGRTGTVWTWTTQNFRPPPPYSGPEEFVPYHIGYVELPGEVIVESYLTGYGDGHPVIGDAVELTIIPFSTNEAGDQVVTYAFRPSAIRPHKEPTHDRRRRHHRGRAAPVRPVPRQVGHRDGCGRRSARHEGRRRRVA